MEKHQQVLQPVVSFSFGSTLSSFWSFRGTICSFQFILLGEVNIQIEFQYSSFMMLLWKKMNQDSIEYIVENAFLRIRSLTSKNAEVRNKVSCCLPGNEISANNFRHRARIIPWFWRLTLCIFGRSQEPRYLSRY